jgi:hypothetical protein
MRDISDGGARLRVDGSRGAPGGFELIIELDGLEAPCRVVSRRDTELGVAFTSRPRTVRPKRAQVVCASTSERPGALRRKPIA